MTTSNQLRRISDHCPEGIPLGFCQCGCGECTSISKGTEVGRGYFKGKPRRFVWGHNRQAGRARLSRLRPYVEVAERALGRPLPKKAHVHHIDRNRDNNQPANLVICQDAAYHRLLHVRLEALEASGDPSKRKCCYCHKWDDVSNLLVYATSRSLRHKSCAYAYSRARHQERKKSNVH